MQPKPRRRPFAFAVAARNLNHFCCLFDGKPTEKTQLDNLALAGIKCGKLLHASSRAIRSRSVVFAIVRRLRGVIKRESNSIASAFRRRRFPGIVNQNLPHHLRGHRKEVGAIAQAHRIVANQSQIGLVHQRGRLQRCDRNFVP